MENRKIIRSFSLVLACVFLFVLILTGCSEEEREKIEMPTQLIKAEKVIIKGFIRRNGEILYEDKNNNKLQDEDEPQYRWLSSNLSNLFTKELGGGKFEPTEWEINEQLKTIAYMGGKVVRTYALVSGSHEGFEEIISGPGEYNEAGLRRLDKIIELCSKNNIRVYIPLVNFKGKGEPHGGTAEWASWYGKEWTDFYTDKDLINEYKNFFYMLANRTNYYTGIKYKDDMTILGWETGNELEPARYGDLPSTPIQNRQFTKWTEEMAEYFKSVAPDQLFIDGKYGVNKKVFDCEYVDVVSDHYYRTPIDKNRTEGKKVFIVGEFGWSGNGKDHLEGTKNTQWLENTINVAFANGCSGMNIWNMMMPNYGDATPKHQDDSLCFTWPGDPDSLFDEVGTMRMMRKIAYQLDGYIEPEDIVPEAPSLQSITSVHMIRWVQGFNTEYYAIERSEHPDSGFVEIASGIRDRTDRMKFDDKTAENGKTYYYRVKGVNSAGSSSYSNVEKATADGISRVIKEYEFFEQESAETSTDLWNSVSDCNLFAYDLGGKLRLYCNNKTNNPTVSSPENIDIVAGNNQKLYITMINGTNSSKGKVQFITDTDSTWDNAKSIEYAIKSQTDLYTTYIVDLSSNDQWNGTIKQIRLVPAVDCNEGYIGIDCIRIVEC